MRRAAAVALLLGACDGATATLLRFDADADCFVSEPYDRDPASAEGGCDDAQTPAVRPDGACVILPDTCLPRDFQPAGASAACDAAVDAWLDGVGPCVSPDDAGAARAPTAGSGTAWPPPSG